MSVPIFRQYPNLTNKEKDLLLEKIDIPKNQQGSYIDAFNQPISFNGNKQLKSPYTKLKLTDVHITEIKECKKDFYYFLYNYCKITTREGISRPEIRDYQKRIIDTLLLEEDTLLLSPRQSGKSVIVGLYLLWQSLFKTDINIGIAGNNHTLAKEVLRKIKQTFLELPIWLTPNVTIWNKSDIAFETNTRILTSATNGDSFRGFTINILYIDEVAFIDKNAWEEFSDAVFPTQASLTFKQNILTSTANGLNHFYHLVNKAKELEEYKFNNNDYVELKNGDVITMKEYYEKYYNNFSSIDVL